MTIFLYNYVLFTIILSVNSISLSYINTHNTFSTPSKRNGLNVVSRTGVCVPEDVGLFGRTIISYECFYTKDGRTQTGDEWEAEMREETKRNFPGVDKRKVKYKKADLSSTEPDDGFERFELPAPFNPTKMLLREGIPHLTISVWAPGLNITDFTVFLNYSKNDYPHSYTGDCTILPTNTGESSELDEYYTTFENAEWEKPHKFSYHSTYNDLFNRMEKPDYGYADVSDDFVKPPLILINFPKNTIVNQWERATFGSKGDPKKRKKLSRIQRAYRPFSHIDLRNVKCVYKDSTLQIAMKLTHVTPPPTHQKNYKLNISSEGEIRPPKSLPLETVHGWMYNWHYFSKYDLNFDLSKFEPPEFTEADKPNFIDDMTPRQLARFMKECDELAKKD
ncbi:putative integral membrane protein [Theileria parva strain Muguga]|uniref:Uncharacterized protein n=1 Tax=Theileria parva TaxID=5875 RepID=Q4N6Z5_THEPA|nr:putative integral membrane protein [Theileria parva strain Muguga]EAN34263.1 putative integral membrane protein [Theileria parva strain Muguga]|eukprot:XP_766546.1 hypothetical protein [Theileria parva strain Muguga]